MKPPLEPQEKVSITDMRLAEFIRENTEEISAEWEKFAGTLLPDEGFSSLTLRNHIDELLERIAVDMEESQSEEQQSKKSKGKTVSKKIEDVSEKHVDVRIEMGISSQQLISEFRALRASIIHLWQQDKEIADKNDLYDLTRFNETIDELLTSAEARYSEKREHANELFLGILAHDLRNPLNAIIRSAQWILLEEQPDRDMVNQIVISATRMSHLITDLIELTRVRLGKGLSIRRTRTDMREICLKALHEMKAAYPNRNFTLHADNDLTDEWDEQKINQVLSNLLGNAVQHGSPDSSIILTAKKVKEGVEIQIHNEGTPIPKKLLPKIFDRFIQEGISESGKDKSGSMGLGLYIAKEIVCAHGGTINAQSSEAEGTTFYAYLPRSNSGDHLTRH